jgi:membrane associated rhomboid family serine protease
MLPIRDHNPSNRVPYVTYMLLALNAGIFLSYVGLFEDPRALNAFFEAYAFIPLYVSAGEGFLGILTSMFLHGGWAHLLGNMLFLYIFGDNVEDELGHGPFLGFYIAGGLAAALAQYASEPLSQVPMVGASGAIAAVMGAYLVLFPKAKVDILIILIIIFRIIPIPAWIMLGLWFGMQVIGGVGSLAGEGGVAFWAHAGGFLAGMILILPTWLREGGPAFWARTHGHPPHPEARYRYIPTNVPRAGRRR